MYDIILSRRSAKYINKLDPIDRNRILIALDKLRIRPQAYLSRLVGIKLYKFRAGNFRIIVDLQKNQLVVLVIKIGHRKNIYK